MGFIFSKISALSRRISAHSNALTFVLANLSQQVTLLLCQLVVLRFIAPAEIGIWHSLLMINTYMLFSQMGITNGMNREYPFLMGKNKKDDARKVIQTSQFYNTINAALICMAFVVLSFVFWNRGWEWRMAFLTMAGVGPLRIYIGFLEGTYRSGHEFHKLSMLKFSQIPILLGTLVLPWFFGFWGYLGRTLLITAIMLLMWYIVRPVKVKSRFDLQTFKLLFATGWRLFLYSYLKQVSMSFPRLALVSLGGTVVLGLATPINWMFVALSGITGSLTVYLYPKLTHRFAKGNSRVGKTSLKAAGTMVLLLLPAALIGLPLVPFLGVILPKYAKSIPAAQVALIASLLECMSIATVSFGVVKAWKLMFTHVTLSLIVRAACAFGGFYLLEDRLLGVAYGMLAASLLMGIVTWLTVSRTDQVVNTSRSGEL